MAKKKTENSAQTDMERLNQLGIALSSEKNLDKLLEMIVTEARSFTHCDAGTLYRVLDKKKVLKFEIMQTESTGYAAGGTTGNKIDLPPVPLVVDGKENHTNVSAHVAIAGEIVNIPDVYEAEGFDFSGPKKYDEITGYRTQSMMVIPMRDHTDKVIGVLQLINSLSPEGERIPFDEKYESLIRSLASQAAVAINNAQLIYDIEHLFKALVNYTVKAIDARSPHTAGHSSRVAKLTRRIAEDMNLQTKGPFADVQFNEEELEEVWIAGLLHDVGKIGVAEHVLEKQNKLDGAKYQVVLDRFQKIKELMLLNGKLRNIQNGDSLEKIDDQLKKELKEWQEDYDFILWVNKPGFLQPEKKEMLDAINEKTFVDAEGNEHPYITEVEYLNFSVVKGNLTDEERTQIQEHVIYTRKLLKKLPFPDRLKNVPYYAASHHEHIDGKGYPDGITGDKIPLPARIMCIADVWDALTAQDRPYKPPIPEDRSCEILRSGAKYGEFDKDVVELFVNHRLWEKKPGEITEFEDEEELES
ncbi:MAG: HD domain-containing phosphohydrolase [Candidatus Marinimicrobia bacterium]|jgi:HD-GYP domain-containing protein (c-di-GMP phosphodiesterase class II)|nr:HD domain-containing phosphohydrolase [Candidatus Neomarinimicrobiota bacterium]